MKNRKSKENELQPQLFASLYEEDFLARTIGGDLMKKPEVALAELVANAWDAGASKVLLTVPDRRGEILEIADDGVGLTMAQFKQRWMTLAYNRQKAQGEEVEFPPGRSGARAAFGRNGQGRHGLLCFANSYVVDTRREGKRARITVQVANGDEPLTARAEMLQDDSCTDTGTTLRAVVERHLPDADAMRNALASKFVHDPNFSIYVNGERLTLMELPGVQAELEVIEHPVTGQDVQIAIYQVELETAGGKQQTGVAFWVKGRLVGQPNWRVMGEAVIDGRTVSGRSLAYIVKCDELINDIEPDWSTFRETEFAALVGDTVRAHIRNRLDAVFSKRASETAHAVVRGMRDGRFKDLGRGARADIEDVVRTIATKSPLTPTNVLEVAANAVAEMSLSASTQALLERIQRLPEKDVEGLHRLLDDWTVRDALKVLDEIGRRIQVVEAIERLMNDKTVNELGVLHPLVLQARWLFGHEYDSPYFASNVTLRNAVKAVIGCETEGVFENPRRRPDIVVRGDAADVESSMGITGVEGVRDSGIVCLNKILIIELKKGGFTIGRKEVEQATNYIEDFMGCPELEGAQIHAFVVGAKVASGVTRDRDLAKGRARLDVVTYAELVDTANRRLFRLRDEIGARCPDTGSEFHDQLDLLIDLK